MKFIENLSFNTGFLSGNVQVEKINNDEYICFGDYRTYKKIVIHSMNSDKTHTIDLSQITSLGEKIMAYEIINLDTVIVLCYHTNNLYFINQSGTIWEQLNLNPYIEQYGSYELMRSSTPFQYNDTSLIFSLSYVDPNLQSSDVENLSGYINKTNTKPKLFKIDNIFSDTLVVSIGADNLYSQFTPKDHIAAEGNQFEFSENGIIFNSSYTDTLYKIDPYNFKIIARKKIVSDYSNLFIQTVSVSKFTENSGIINENFKSDGQIREVIWDEKKQVYYCFTSHKVIDEKTPMSIIILDAELNKVDEFKFDENKYQFAGLLTSKGLLISNYNETLNDVDHFQKNTYSLFSYE